MKTSTKFGGLNVGRLCRRIISGLVALEMGSFAVAGPCTMSILPCVQACSFVSGRINGIKFNCIGCQSWTSSFSSRGLAAIPGVPGTEDLVGDNSLCGLVSIGVADDRGVCVRAFPILTLACGLSNAIPCDIFLADRVDSASAPKL